MVSGDVRLSEIQSVDIASCTAVRIGKAAAKSGCATKAHRVGADAAEHSPIRECIRAIDGRYSGINSSAVLISIAGRSERATGQ